MGNHPIGAPAQSWLKDEELQAGPLGAEAQFFYSRVKILILKLLLPKSWMRIGSGIIALLALFAPHHALANPLDTWHRTNPWPQGISLRVSYGNGIFVGVGDYGALYTSVDGAVWMTRYTGTGHLLCDVAFGSSTFVAAGAGGMILTSPNGEIWTIRGPGTSHNLNGVAYGDNAFVAVGDRGAILTSPEGKEWTVRDSGTQQTLKKVAFGGNGFVAVGVNGTILTSPTGVVWTAQAAGTSGHLEGIAHGNDTFVAVGEAVLTSPDGIAWTKRDAGTDHRFSGVAYGGGTFAAVGDNGAIFTSPDGSVWTRRDSGTGFDLFAIAHGGGSFVAAGEGGTLLQSNPLPSPRISVSPASLSFGPVNVAASSTQTLTVTNSGSADLSIQRMPISGADNIDFITQNDQCTGTTVPPAQNCTVQVVFSPHTSGSKTATLSISSNDSSTPTQSVPLSGSGVAVSSNTSYCLFTWLADGSGLEPYLEIFRKFRDFFLLESRPGIAMVDLYYRHSPSMVDFIAPHEFLREILRWSLIPLAVLCHVVLITSPAEWGFLFALMGWSMDGVVRRRMGLRLKSRESGGRGL